MRSIPLIYERFEYRDMHRRLGVCAIEAIALPESGIAVIATELKDNPGMSITNAAEYVATAVCKKLRLGPHLLVWIEHYGYPSPVPKLTRTYDRVTFARITPDQELFFHEPNWSAMKEQDWRALGLEPRPNEP
jgi:hypothetical protein